MVKLKSMTRMTFNLERKRFSAAAQPPGGLVMARSLVNVNGKAARRARRLPAREESHGQQARRPPLGARYQPCCPAPGEAAELTAHLA